MRPTLFLASALLLLPACALPGSSAWSGAHLSAQAGGMLPSASGTIGVSAAAPPLVISDRADIGDDLGLGEADTTLYAGATVGFAPFEVELSMFDFGAAGTGSLAADLNLGGYTFDASLPVSSSLDVQSVQLGLSFDLWNSGHLRIAPMVGVDLLDLNFVVTGTDTITGISQTETVNEQLPLPVLGAKADLLLTEDLRAGAQIAGFGIDVGDIEATLIDLDAGLYWSPSLGVEAFLGYRQLDLQLDGEVDNQAADVDFLLSGPYFGVAITF